MPYTQEKANRMNGFKRIIEVIPAYDKRDLDPAKNYGVHGVELRMLLQGSEGAVQFVVYTNRQLEHVQREFVSRLNLDQKILNKLGAYHGSFTLGKEIGELIEWQRYLNSIELDDILLAPMPADLGYHSKVPLYDGQEPMRTMLRSPKFKDGNFEPGVWGDPIICPYLEGDVPCYYDGSGLNARPVYQKMIVEGEESVWATLEEYYSEVLV